ncbi:L-asparaginase 1 [Halomonadaceae bacterium LMG 33818]|uniref:asparaginase n=1 Tax=Cernens ardua TaxID=3402176 RepID=UPI003EDBD69C
MSHSDTSHTSFIQVLYTGGTIGMQPSAAGLAPASGFETLAREAQSFAERSFPDWKLKELDPLIDSANLEPALWTRLVDECVEAKHQGATGILVLHGTDTLAYTAAALSFRLADFPLPVVITGSMLPAGVSGSDAWENYFDSLGAFDHLNEAGVHVQFHGQLMSGVACRKLSSSGYHAFGPVEGLPAEGMKTLSTLPPSLQVAADHIAVNIAVVPLFPGILAEQLKALLTNVKGLVLECYGSGTAPSDNEPLFAVLEDAIKGGVVVVAISQCLCGGVTLGHYAAGSRLSDIGVISGGGMTREAAFGKLHWLLGSGLSEVEKRQWMSHNVLGELGENA